MTTYSPSTRPWKSIANEGFAPALDVADRQRFLEWQRTSQRAWLFLDAADELKVTRNTVRPALRRVADSIDPTAFEHVHAVISSRPSDWHTVLDGAALSRPPPLADATPQRNPLRLRTSVP